mmetsp:Transcript_26624/g.76196  ORF Transcript_26624/g.76196 Transcript_26624/m.76196 type:complete len:215 (-) Transcript_26624:1259-1903(-)
MPHAFRVPFDDHACCMAVAEQDPRGQQRVPAQVLLPLLPLPFGPLLVCLGFHLQERSCGVGSDLARQCCSVEHLDGRNDGILVCMPLHHAVANFRGQHARYLLRRLPHHAVDRRRPLRRKCEGTAIWHVRCFLVVPHLPRRFEHLRLRGVRALLAPGEALPVLPLPPQSWCREFSTLVEDALARESARSPQGLRGLRRLVRLERVVQLRSHRGR